MFAAAPEANDTFDIEPSSLLEQLAVDNVHEPLSSLEQLADELAPATKFLVGVTVDQTVAEDSLIREAVYGGITYKVDKSPLCVPGHMQSLFASDLSKEMYKKLVVKDKDIWTKTHTAKERETKVKEKKGAIDLFKMSLESDAKRLSLSGSSYPQVDNNPATQVLCDFDEKDFADGISESTKVVAKKAYIDNQLIAHHNQGDDVPFTLYQTEILRMDTNYLEMSTEFDSATAAVLISHDD